MLFLSFMFEPAGVGLSASEPGTTYAFCCVFVPFKANVATSVIAMIKIKPVAACFCPRLLQCMYELQIYCPWWLIYVYVCAHSTATY